MDINKIHEFCDSGLRWYDEPIKLMIEERDKVINDSIRSEIYKVITKYSIDIDEEKLIRILKEDKSRYREAWMQGFAEGMQMNEDKLNKIRDILDEKEE